MNSLMMLIAWTLSALVGAFVGSYLGSYMKKKGENLATHEDIDKLVDQVRAVTSTTKQIEAQISSDLWDRQKRWELRRDTLFELTKRLGILKDSVVALVACHQTDFEQGWQNDFNRTANRIRLGHEWLDAASAFDNAILLLRIVCDEKLYKAVLQFSLVTRQMAAKAKEWDADTLTNGSSQLGKELAVVLDALQKELDRVSGLNKS